MREKWSDALFLVSAGRGVFVGLACKARSRASSEANLTVDDRQFSELNEQGFLTVRNVFVKLLGKWMLHSLA